MRSLFLQIAAVTTINLKSLQQRLWLSLSTVVAIALVVIVLLSFLAMANGFRRTIEGSGADDVAVVLRGGSQSEINSVVTRDQAQLIEEGAGIAQGHGGQAVGLGRALSHGRRRQTGDGTKANLPLRGIGAEGAALRHGIVLTEGRMFSPGANEIVVGKGVVKRILRLRPRPNSDVRRRQMDSGRDFLRRRDGVRIRDLGRRCRSFKACSSAVNVFQTVRARLTSPAALADLRTYADKDPRIKGLDIKSEAAYFADQASQHLEPHPEARLAARHCDGVRRARRRAQHDVLVGCSASDRDRDVAGHRVRRCSGIRRHADRIAHRWRRSAA